MKPPSEPTSLTEQTYPLEFTGSAGEYFRIWIINVLLSVATLGIYYAWAKVRTRQYFYAHTTLDGHAFDYLANPIALLKGNLILASGVLLLFFSQQFVPELGALVILGFYAVIPYLMYKSLRFRLYNSAYRNIRMHFHGSVGNSYRVYFWWPMLVSLTLGLLFPYMMYLKKKYVFDHIAYGTTRLKFNGAPRSFYYMCLGISGVAVLVMVLAIPLLAWLASIFGESADIDPVTMSILLPVTYLVLIFATSFIQQYIYTWSNNYCWNNSTLAHIRFHSSLRIWPMVGIRITNLLAIICSLGMLIPWARIRRTRYILNHMELIVAGDLDHFTAAQGQDEHALGDVSSDFLDIEVGL